MLEECLLVCDAAVPAVQHDSPAAVCHPDPGLWHLPALRLLHQVSHAAPFTGRLASAVRLAVRAAATVLLSTGMLQKIACQLTQASALCPTRWHA